MFRYALRSLRRSPVFTVVTVLSLGLALALNTTLFALVDAVVHPYVPYVHADRILAVSTFSSAKDVQIPGSERARALRDNLRAASEVAEYTFAFTMIQGGGMTEDAGAVAVSPNIFHVLGVRPVLGRNFDPEVSGTSAQAIISYSLWNHFFHALPLEQHLKVTVGSGTYDVIGVMPQAVHFPNSDVWVPLASAADSGMRRFGPNLLIRLRPGATREMAYAEAAGAMAALAKTYHRYEPYAVRLGDLTTRFGARYETFNAMLGIVGLVLLIACANLGTMMLARGVARRRELAIRIAIGAARRDIVAQVLAECGAIVTAGLVIGFVLMLWALHSVPHLLEPYVPGLGDLRATPSWRVFAFAGAVAVVTTLLAGAWPAFRASGIDPMVPINEGGTSSERIRDRYNPLIIVEVALSTGLLMASGLFVLFAIRLASFEFRYDATNLVTADLRVDAHVTRDSSATERFYDQLVDRWQRVPHVVSVATVRTDIPDHWMLFSEEGRSGNHWMNAGNYNVVSPQYLRTLGIPIVAGRDFQAGDRGASGAVAIVDQEAARRLWPDLPSPVGHMLKLGEEKSKAPWVRVIGVARSVELQPRKDIDLPPDPSVYVVLGHDYSRDQALVVRGDGAGGYAGRSALIVSLRREIQAAAPWMGFPRVRPMLEQYDNMRSYTSFLATVLATFGAFGLVLCAVGLYGVLAYSVSRRLREFAIRSALGARAADVVRIVLHDTTVTVLAGIGIGAFLGLAGTHKLGDALFVVHYEFAIALMAAELLLIVAGALACVGPLRQAVKADPVEILRAN